MLWTTQKFLDALNIKFLDALNISLQIFRCFEHFPTKFDINLI